MPRAKVDPIGRYLAEYMSGYRCMTCDGLRDQHGRCDHERAEDFDQRQFEVEHFVRSTGANAADRRDNLLFGAAASALKRSSLQAGNRDTRHPTVMAEHRARLQGKTIEWRPHQRPSGDELPL